MFGLFIFASATSEDRRVFISEEHFFPEIKLPSLAMRLKKTLVFVKGQNKVISCVEGHTRARSEEATVLFSRARALFISDPTSETCALRLQIFSFIGLLGTFAGFFQSEYNSVNAADRAKQRVYAKYRALSCRQTL